MKEYQLQTAVMAQEHSRLWTWHKEGRGTLSHNRKPYSFRNCNRQHQEDRSRDMKEEILFPKTHQIGDKTKESVTLLSNYILQSPENPLSKQQSWLRNIRDCWQCWHKEHR